jgi:hypothetical protein
VAATAADLVVAGMVEGLAAAASTVAEGSVVVPTVVASAEVDFTEEGDLAAIAVDMAATAAGMEATAVGLADRMAASEARQEASAAELSAAAAGMQGLAAGLPVEGRGWAIAPQPMPGLLMGGGMDSEVESDWARVAPHSLVDGGVVGDAVAGVDGEAVGVVIRDGAGEVGV